MKILKSLSRNLIGSSTTINLFLFAVVGFYLNKIIKNFKGEDYFQNLSTFGSTLTSQESNTYADSLHVSMASVGTDFETIKDVFLNIKNQKNYNKVYNSFGTRGYVPVIGVGKSIGDFSKLNLNQWLYEELTREEFEFLKENYSIVF
jgi:hypothetical protein